MAFQFNFYTQIIDVLEPQTTIDVQSLVNAIRQAEFSNDGLAYPHICEASGKTDLGGGVITGISIYLYPNWQIRFWTGNYTATITGGNLVGGLGGQPIAYTPGVQVIIVQSASSTLVFGTGGLTQAEHDKLMTGLDVSVPDAVWDEMLTGHTLQGSAGRTIAEAKRKATLASLKK